MVDKQSDLDGEPSRVFMTRVEAAGLAAVSDPEDSRVGQVGMILAETLGLTLGPAEHVVLGHAVLHARRSLARTRAPAIEEE